MSDPKKGLGIFVSKRSGASASAAAAPASAIKPKNVKKRWLYVGGGLVAGVMLVATVFQEEPPARREAKAPSGTIAVNPPNSDAKLFEADYRRRLEALEVRTNNLSGELARKNQEIEALRREEAAKKANATTPALTPPINGTVVLPPTPNGGGLGVLGGTGDAPPAPPIPPMPTSVGGSFKAPSLSTGGTPPHVPLPAPSSSDMGGGPLVFEAPGAAAKAKAANTVQARATMVKNPNAGMLPAGAFAPVSLLNGLDAGTSSATQTNPQPILMNVYDQATLPGAARYRIKNCFVLGTGYGDMSAERVYGRVSRLSCVDKAGKLVLSQEVSGYIVDSDGKLGLRGRVTNRQGAKLHSALLAGFAQGLAGALGQAQSDVTSNLSTGMTSSSISGGAALRASGLAGAQSATNQLAEFYLKEAQSIFPVITVDAGRTATVVFTNNVSLEWGSSEGEYVRDVNPTNN